MAEVSKSIIELPEHAEGFQRYSKTPGFTCVLDKYDHGVINDSKIVLYNAGKSQPRYVVCDRKEFVVWYCEKIKSTPNYAPYFHEVVCDVNRKFIIDIDAKTQPTPETIARIHDETIECMQTAFYLLYDIVLTSRDIMVFNSHGVNKVSFHFIISGYCGNNLTTFEFQRNVRNMATSELANYIDNGIYKRTQNIRLCGSFKSFEDAEMRRKRPYGSLNVEQITPEIVLNSLIGYTPGGRVIEDPKVLSSANNPTESSLPDSNCEITNIIISAVSKWGEMANHKIRHRKGNRLIFNRLKGRPSECFVCKHEQNGVMVKRVHEHDNTLALVVTIVGKSDSEFNAVIHAKCIKDVNCLSVHVAECNIPAEFINPDLVVNYRDSALRKTLAEMKLHGWSKWLPHEPWLNTPRDHVHEYEQANMHKYELTPTLCVVAPMKTGKTVTLNEYITANYDDNAKIVICSFRQTFANEIKAKFPDFALYSQIRGEINENRLIIQVESLHRIMMTPGAQPPDLLVLDECESIFEQFDSGLLRQFNESFAIFSWMLKFSRRVVLMDANLGQRTHNILLKMRPDYPPFYHVNTKLGMLGDKYYLTGDKITWYSALYASVLRGERSAIAVNSLQEAKILHYDLSNEYPAVKFKIYSSETSHAERKQHFAQVNEYWSQYDVVIYTPTVSAGISYEREHFDNVFGFFSDQSCNVETCIQMIGRVRNVKCHNFIIYLSGTRQFLPTTAEEINALILRNRRELYSQLGDVPLKLEYNADATIKFYTTEYYDIWLENIIMRNYSKNNFVARFAAIISRNGATVEYIDEKLKHELCLGMDKPAVDIVNRCEELKSKLIAEHAQNVSVAAEIDDECAASLREKVKSQIDITKDENNALCKYNLRKHYNWHENLTPEFVITYDTKHAREVYINLRRITRSAAEYNLMNPPLPQLRAALCLIQQEEKVRYNEVMANDAKYQNTDISRKYVFNTHWIACSLLWLFKIQELWDESMISRDVVYTRLRESETDLVSLLNGRRSDFMYRELKLEDIKTKYNDRDAYVKYLLKPINTILQKTYDCKIALRSKIGMCEVTWTQLFVNDMAKSAGAYPWI
jgi:hypothetical protein